MITKEMTKDLKEILKIANITEFQFLDFCNKLNDAEKKYTKQQVAEIFKTNGTFYTDLVNPPKEIKVGDYIRGFKYGSSEGYISMFMDKYNGQIGEVIEVDKENNNVDIKFSNGKSYYYPLDQAIEHLANAEDILKDSPFHKPDFSHLKEKFNKENIKPKLYSILLSKGNQRIIYIDLTELELNVKKDKYNDYHCIVIEQGNGKGIKIDLRY